LKAFKIVEVQDELFQTNWYYGTKKEIKDLPGFIKILEEKTVKHPSPELLGRVLLSYGINLHEFYKRCDEGRVTIYDYYEEYDGDYK
jgi:hypothetical protein